MEEDVSGSVREEQLHRTKSPVVQWSQIPAVWWGEDHHGPKRTDRLDEGTRSVDGGVVDENDGARPWKRTHVSQLESNREGGEGEAAGRAAWIQDQTGHMRLTITLSALERNSSRVKVPPVYSQATKPVMSKAARAETLSPRGRRPLLPTGFLEPPLSP